MRVENAATSHVKANVQIVPFISLLIIVNAPVLCAVRINIFHLYIHFSCGRSLTY